MPGAITPPNRPKWWACFISTPQPRMNIEQGTRNVECCEQRLFSVALCFSVFLCGQNGAYIYRCPPTS